MVSIVGLGVLSMVTLDDGHSILRSLLSGPYTYFAPRNYSAQL